jgi:DNA-binding beta-propeller fold protein YncE
MMRLAVAVVVFGALCSCAPDVGDISTSGGPPGFISTSKERHALEITGGTLQIVQGGTAAAAVDADRARIWLVELSSMQVRATLDLPPDSAPGRMAVDTDGYLYVALRGTGEVAKIAMPSAQLVSTREVCGDPRGLAWDGQANVMRIACADGSLVALPPEGPATSVRVTPDLRDVLLTPGGLAVTTFRAAQIVTPGNPEPLNLPQASVSGTANVNMVPHVAWRAVVAPNGAVVVAHQREVDGPVENLQIPTLAGTATTSTGGAYSSAPSAGCSTPVVRSALSITPMGATTDSPRFVEMAGTLPVDVAVSPDGKEAAVAMAGSSFVERVQMSGANELSLCAPQPSAQAITANSPDGVAYTPAGVLVIHTRNPSGIMTVTPAATRSVVLDSKPLTNEGQTIFHTPVNGIACASCHPEGRDDGHVWNIAGERRRTPSLAGGLLETAPFHWQGELVDMHAVVGETFVHRMGGAMPDSHTIDALGDWLEGVPRPAPTRTLSAKLFFQGKELFERPDVGCTTCHTGAALTSDQTLFVGTGDKFQVPSLRGVGSRAPYLHDGRAPTLRDRFAPMGGGNQHGNTSQLTDHELDLLVGYLETL